MTKRAILYARVSTDEQAEKGYSLPTQLEAGRAYAEQHGYLVAAELQDDYSGAKLDRPGLDQIRMMVDRREAEAVIVYTADRLTRNLAHSLILREEWQRAGVELHYCNRGKSENTPESRMTENIEAVFGDYWREKIMEGSRRGRMAKAKAGKWVGAGNVPYGYRKVGKGRETYLVIDEYEAAIVKRIFGLYIGTDGNKPLSREKIAAQLTTEGIPLPGRGRVNRRGWYSNTVSAILNRRGYLGEMVYAGQTILLPELAIIDLETYEAAQKQRLNNLKLSRRNRKYNYLLSRYLFCICGARMTASVANITKKKPYFHYYCNRMASDRHLHSCRERRVNSTIADGKVWDWLHGLITDDSKLNKGLDEMRARRAAEWEPKRARLALVGEMIEKADRTITRLAARVSKAERDDDQTTADALEAEMKAESKNREAISREAEILARELAQGELTPEKEERIRLTVQAIRTRIEGATFEQKRDTVILFDCRVQLRRDEANLRWLDVTCGIPDWKTSLCIGKSSPITFFRFF
jgi:site-specific DNA recombinase